MRNQQRGRKFVRFNKPLEELCCAKFLTCGFYFDQHNSLLHNRKGRKERVSLKHIIAEFQNEITTFYLLIGRFQFFLETITGPVRKLFIPINSLLPSCAPFLGSMARGSYYEVIKDKASNKKDAFCKQEELSVF